ncbi:MAG: hypothetical protein KDN19_17110, partial [Verrucomicrobiae bacterium]|nr:hypothetical protein [Verrucomicrobiae bacterium]
FGVRGLQLWGKSNEEPILAYNYYNFNNCKTQTFLLQAIFEHLTRKICEEFSNLNFFCAIREISTIQESLKINGKTEL